MDNIIIYVKADLLFKMNRFQCKALLDFLESSNHKIKPHSAIEIDESSVVTAIPPDPLFNFAMSALNGQMLRDNGYLSISTSVLYDALRYHLCENLKPEHEINNHYVRHKYRVK